MTHCLWHILRRTALTGILIGAAAAGICAPKAGASEAVAAGQYSSNALYNQGNAFARQGNAAMAVLYYERARVLAPGDPDIQANLTQVRTAAGLAQADSTWLERHARLANPNLLYWLGAPGLALALGGALRIRFGRRRGYSGGLALMLGVLMAAMVALDAAVTWPLTREAVVMHAATARVSPVTGSGTLFAIPAGQVVRLSDVYGDFALVRTPSGQAGWVALSDVARVI